MEGSPCSSGRRPVFPAASIRRCGRFARSVARRCSFRAGTVRIFGRDITQELEVATFERPHRLRLFAEHPDLHYELDYLIDAIFGGGSRIMLIFRSRPETSVGRALSPFMTPFMGITLRDELERDLVDLASAVGAFRAKEHGHVSPR